MERYFRIETERIGIIANNLYTLAHYPYANQMAEKCMAVRICCQSQLTHAALDTIKRADGKGWQPGSHDWTFGSRVSSTFFLRVPE